MLPAALALIVAAAFLIRLGWDGRRGAAEAGWAAAAVGLALLAHDNGAWGLAIGTVAGMASVLAIVLHAGLVSPPKVQRAPREAPRINLPRHPSDLLRRLAVFVLVVPAGFAAAQWLAFGLQAIGRRAGMAETDANVLMLFLQPIVWGALMTWQMTRTGPAQMATPPALAAIGGTLLWGLA